MQWMKTQRWEVNQKLVRLSKNCYKGMYCVYVQAYHKNSINLRRAYKKGGGGGLFQIINFEQNLMSVAVPKYYCAS